MSDEEFWSLIERSRISAQSCDGQAEKLSALLDELPTPEIMELWRLWWGKMGALDRRDVWAVASIINGGCSDDGFTYFRGWVIAHGRAFFEAALEKPESVAQGIPEGEEGKEAECEEILSCSSEIYFERTGRAPFEDDTDTSSDSEVGDLNERWPNEPWREEDFERLYPELCARFDS